MKFQKRYTIPAGAAFVFGVPAIVCGAMSDVRAKESTECSNNLNSYSGGVNNLINYCIAESGANIYNYDEIAQQCSEKAIEFVHKVTQESQKCTDKLTESGKLSKAAIATGTIAAASLAAMGGIFVSQKIKNLTSNAFNSILDKIQQRKPTNDVEMGAR